FYSIFIDYGKDVASFSHNYHLQNRGVARFEKVEHVIKKFSLPKKDFDKIIINFSTIVFKGVCDSPLVDGIKDFLVTNHNKYNFYIISATPTIELLKILKVLNLTSYFKNSYGSPNNKKYWLSHLIKTNEISNSNSLFIGDAYSDKDAAKKYSIDFCLRLTGDNDNLIDSDIVYTIENFNKFNILIK
ncbi:HAD hydrolase-like protein, partial [Candidatus Marinimicrobia bacterium]|nr:HAD hydrolase-like protein [Candidatus Neomarinimicrobiota bacterium]